MQDKDSFTTSDNLALIDEKPLSSSFMQNIPCVLLHWLSEFMLAVLILQANKIVEYDWASYINFFICNLK